ncbi:MAG: UDP-N-acetylmuramoyl-tripeptide--D-alanyl-D-alanine ligase [Gemmatimonadaceae bacterium]
MSADQAKPAAAEPQPRFWTLDRVADALAYMPDVTLRPRGPTPIARIWTDSRTVRRGDLFVALTGPRFDGHEFLAQAVQAGAGALIVSRPDAAAGLGVPTFVVGDTLVALGALARYRRRVWGRTVIGVVGTNGKTSTKELVRAALGARMQVHATEGNYNNLVGVPLTIFALPDDADVAAVEMGTNQPGEIARLRAVAEPEIGVVTSVAEEHLEGLGDLNGVLREELSGVEGTRVAVVPASQPEVVAAARGRAARVVAAGLDAGDLRPARWGIGVDGAGWLEIEGVDVRPPVRGVHNLRNAMLALAVARECGVSFEDAARGIAGMRVPPMRVNFQQVGRATVINDAYNSNPGSARAALELLEHAGRGRQRVAVLGSMLEMGAHSPRLHRDVAAAALGGPIEIVAGVGEFAEALAGLEADRERVVTASGVEELWGQLVSRLRPDAVILLKGSRGVRLERLVAPITEWAERVASAETRAVDAPPAR